MADKKAKNPKYKTPRCIASYPYFTKPDEYKGAVRYKADLIMDAEEAAPLMAQCEEVLKNYIEQYNADIDAKGKGKKLNLKKALVTGLPWEEHEEDESKVVFKVKQNAVINGEDVKLLIYDAKGKPITENIPLIRGGSVVKVAGTIRAYDGFGGGVTLSISAVQIIELSQGSGGDAPAADKFGFGDEGEGYEYDEDDVPPFDTDEDGSPTDFEDDNEDDQDADF